MILFITTYGIEKKGCEVVLKRVRWSLDQLWHYAIVVFHYWGQLTAAADYNIASKVAI